MEWWEIKGGWGRLQIRQVLINKAYNTSTSNFKNLEQFPRSSGKLEMPLFDAWEDHQKPLMESTEKFKYVAPKEKNITSLMYKGWHEGKKCWQHTPIQLYYVQISFIKGKLYSKSQ